MPQKQQFYPSVWVSYSYANKELVYKLTKHAAENDTCKFKLYTYLRCAQDEPWIKDEDDAMQQNLSNETNTKYTFFLSSGQRINDLIKCIGGNVHRAVFISKAYLKSKYCLQELMCCLIRTPETPLYIVIIGIGDSLESVREKRIYPFINETETFTLEEALVVLYTTEWKEPGTEFKIKDEKKLEETDKGEYKKHIKRFFEKRLDDLADRVSNNDIKASVIETNDQIDALTSSLNRYVDVIKFDDIVQQSKERRKEKLTTWFDTTELGRRACMYDFSDNNMKKQAQSPAVKAAKLNDWLFNPGKYINKIRGFCHFLEKLIKGDRNKLNEFEVIQEISSMIMTTIINPFWAAELKHNHLTNSVIRIAEPSEDKEKRMFEIHIALAAALGHNLQFKITPGTEKHIKVCNEVRLNPIGLEEREEKQYDILNEVVSIATNNVIEKDTSPCDEKIADWRLEISDFQMRNTISSIILSASQSRFDTKSKFIEHAVSKFLLLVNKELILGEEPLQFCILLLTFNECPTIAVNSLYSRTLQVPIKRLITGSYKNE